MEISLKQRLIGASVLIALAVIFVPMFLDGSGQEGRVTDTSIVIPEPEFKFEEQLPRLEEMNSESLATSPLQSNRVVTPETTELSGGPLHAPFSAQPARSQAKSQPVTNPPVVLEAQTPLGTNSAPKSRVEPKPATKANSSSSGWVVQVGSFRQKTNAVKLRNQLRSAGYAAFEDKSANAKAPIYRVKVGPESKRDRAVALRAKLLSQQKLKGIVIQHP